jgi:hypothetical protein
MVDQLHNEFKKKIAVSGTALSAGPFPEDMLQKAYAIGAAIARAGAITVTGATTGAPQWAAKGAHEAGGFVLGLSPALNIRHHVHTYGLPTDFHDIILYTGMGYAVRDLLLTRAGDALISVSGRMGSMNEFTDAFQDKRPQGVLLHTGGIADEIKELIDKTNPGYTTVVFEEDPEVLVSKVMAMLASEESQLSIAPSRYDI